ncbi:MAG: hypothetical protein OXL40_13600 [Bacteroidota bacterium]|nr:hypothetical protein [Bacteroidota bacterium]
MGSSKYRLRFSELAYQHFFGEGAFSASSVFARWDARVNEIHPMIIPDSAQWGDFKNNPAKNSQDWRQAVGYVREQFFPSRTPFVIEQLGQARRRELGLSGDPLVEAPLYGDIHTFSTTDVHVPETTLEQKYPNPFNPITVVSFSIHSERKVELSMHDPIS